MPRRFGWTLAGIVVAAAVLRLFRLDHFSYGLDEVLQGFWIRGTRDFFWKSLRFDAVHPPLDYLIDRFVERLHPTDALRKIPAVAWGAGTVVAFGLLIARRAGRTAGLAAAALLAFAPYHVRYSQELRPYALGLLLLCLALLALELFLEHPSVARLAALFLACLATAYALYLAAVVLGVAACAMLIEDGLSEDPLRRRSARRFLAWSPLFLFALWLAYLPWWPVVLEAAHRAPMAPRAPLSFSRADRVLSYFAFAPDDGRRLGAAGMLFLALAGCGAWLSLRRPRQRVLLAWALGGLAVIEILGQVHPHFDFSRRFLPAAPGLTALAAVGLSELLRRPIARLAGAGVLTAVLVLDLRGLALYFRDGRADWRTLADFLRREAAPSERVFTENQYAQLCVAYYLVGPDWLYDVTAGRRPSRELPNLDGQTVRLTWAWKPETRAWLVLAGEPRHPELRRWAERFPAFSFPKAEGAILRRLDPGLRSASFGEPR